MQNTAPSQSQKETIYSARDEIEDFMRSFSAFARTPNSTHDISHIVGSEKRSLDDRDLTTALNMIDMLFACIDIGKIRFADLEVRYHLEINRIKAQSQQHAQDNQDLVVAYNSLRAENSHLKNQLASFHVVSADLHDQSATDL